MKLYTALVSLLLISPFAINAMQSVEDYEDEDWDLVLQTHNEQEDKGKRIEQFRFSRHALDRMKERKVGEKNASFAAANGHRYPTDKSKTKTLRVDFKKEIGVIVDDSSNVVITVLNMNKERLHAMLESIKQKKYAPPAPKVVTPPVRSTHPDTMAELDAFKL